MDKVMEKWNEILQMVKEEHGLTDVSFNTWIKPLEVFAIDGNTLYILVPSEQMGLSYINKKYYLRLCGLTVLRRTVFFLTISPKFILFRCTFMVVIPI